jgi:hypothetical protein
MNSGWTTRKERERILASLAANPDQLCKVCGMPLAKCRQLLGLESRATHAAIIVVDEPAQDEPAQDAPPPAPVVFTTSLFE